MADLIKNSFLSGLPAKLVNKVSCTFSLILPSIEVFVHDSVFIFYWLTILVDGIKFVLEYQTFFIA